MSTFEDKCLNVQDFVPEDCYDHTESEYKNKYQVMGLLVGQNTVQEVIGCFMLLLVLPGSVDT